MGGYSHALFLHLGKGSQNTSDFRFAGGNQMVIQGDGEYGQYNLGCLLRIGALDGALADSLADDVSQDGLQLG